MRYLKKFENFTPEYQKDDYVLLDVEKVRMNNGDLNDESLDDVYNVFSILSKIKSYYETDDYPYELIFPNGETAKVLSDEISRKLTPDEIDEFELKKSTMKYNL